jgi:hypothetical protein
MQALQAMQPGTRAMSDNPGIVPPWLLLGSPIPIVPDPEIPRTCEVSSPPAGSVLAAAHTGADQAVRASASLAR